MRKTINAPINLSLPNAIEFCEMLQSLESDTEFVIDFSQTKGLVEPFGMLLVSSEIQRLGQRKPDSKLSCRSFEHMTYAGHMGFFQAFGLDFGKRPGQANGSSNYVPLTILSTEKIIKDAAISGHEVGDEIEELSKRLSETLCSQSEGALFDTLSYSIREIVRNVVEHSEATQFGICSQYWPGRGKAEVAIIDRGIGLMSSLSHNPHIAASDDKSSINYALMPAVSGKAFKGARRRSPRSPWNNSGFGLYMTSRICRNGGNFFIGSGATGMLLTSGAQAKRYFAMTHSGTAVRLTINTSQLIGLKESLERYRNEGYAIQNKYREIVNIDPSSASLMLSEDFDLSIWTKLLQTLKLKK